MTTGDLVTAEAFIRDEVDVQRQTGFGWRNYTLHLFASILMWRGQWSEAERAYQDTIEAESESCFTGSASSALSVLHAHRGNGQAVPALEQIQSTLPQPGGSHLYGVWEQALSVIEGRAMLGERQAAAALYPLVLSGLELGVVTSLNNRLWQMVAGIAAACGQHWDAAQEHYETALQQAHDLPHKIAQPEVRRWYAQMLLDRDAPGDRDQARTLLGEAMDQYRTIGMPKHLAMAEGMLKDV